MGKQEDFPIFLKNIELDRFLSIWIAMLLSSRKYFLKREWADPKVADATFLKMSVAEKNEFLFQKGVNFNDLPNWQKRGTGLYWETYEKEAVNPQTGEAVTAQQKRLKVDYDLPMKEAYGVFIRNFA